MYEASLEGRAQEYEVMAQQDALRYQRWKESARAIGLEEWELVQQAKAESERRRARQLEPRSIGEIMATPNQKGLVILGDPGSGKSTLLHYLALTQARESFELLADGPADDPPCHEWTGLQNNAP